MKGRNGHWLEVWRAASCPDSRPRSLPTLFPMSAAAEAMAVVVRFQEEPRSVEQKRKRKGKKVWRWNFQENCCCCCCRDTVFPGSSGGGAGRAGRAKTLSSPRPPRQPLHRNTPCLQPSPAAHTAAV